MERMNNTGLIVLLLAGGGLAYYLITRSSGTVTSSGGTSTTTGTTGSTGSGTGTSATTPSLASIYALMQALPQATQQLGPDDWGVLFTHVSGIQYPASILVMGNNSSAPISLDTYWAALSVYAKANMGLSGARSVWAA
jgi:hypothetical protein